MSYKDKYDKLMAVVAESVPGFEVRYKDQSWHQKLIGKLMFFNSRYMVSYTSTFYPCVYYPTQAFEERDYKARFRTLSHEYVHLWDNKGHRFWFPFSYISPQIWGLAAFGAIGAIWSAWFLLCLMALLFLAPVPSPWRTQWEIRGYSMNLFLEYYQRGSVSDATIMRIVDQFTGSGYYFMWPFRSGMYKHINRAIQAVKSGSIMSGQEGKPYRDVLAVLQDE